MAMVLLSLFCLFNLVNSSLQNNVTSVPSINQNGTQNNVDKTNVQQILEKLYKEIYSALYKTNHPITFKKKIDGEVCMRQTDQISSYLVKILKYRVEDEKPVNCVRPQAQPTTTTTTTKTNTASTSKKIDAVQTSPTHSSITNGPTVSSTPTVRLINNNAVQQRRRRSLNGSATMTNNEIAILKELRLDAIGAKAKKIGCIARREKTTVNTVNQCPSCYYEIELPKNHYPQFHTHMTCGTKDDNSCFSNQGICSKTIRIVQVAILDPTSPRVVGQREMELTTCCSCEIVSGNVFEGFV